MRRVLLLALGLLSVSTVVRAWPAELAPALSRDARRLLPRSLAQLLAERQGPILDAAARMPLPLTRALASVRASGRVDGAAAAAIDAEVDRAVRLLKEQRVEEGLVALGALYRIGAELSDPILLTRAAYPSGVVGEYYAFVRSKMSTMPVVLDDRAVLKGDRAAVRTYWQSVLTRSAQQADVVRSEFVRGGRLVRHEALDERSPAFGVAQLAYSRAVTAIAATWLVAWREAHGDETRTGAVPVVRPTNVPPTPSPPIPTPTPGTERP